MGLKRYQERVVEALRVYLETLAQKRAAGSDYPSIAAWDAVKDRLRLVGNYRARKNGIGADLPTFAIKVPTGGGKTLLAAYALGLVHETIHKDRNGTGLALWVVPSDQIYKDTLKALRDRKHFYRQALESAVGGRIEIWEKHEVFRLTPAQLRSNLNVLVLKLASTNREDREQLKFFRDSGGNIVQHFPPEDEPEAHKELKKRVPNLGMVQEDEETGRFLVETSLGNLVRLCEPAVILDEGHKATSRLARETIEGFNASIVIELSATPQKDANILVRVSGRELLDEQMIKLPINIANSNERSWKDCLAKAKEKRDQLAKRARKHLQQSGRWIRPIVLVQVERTGKEQRGAKWIHSEDVREHLIQRLGVPAAAIAVKTSEKDELENWGDLEDEGCSIEWIITKAALQEGWDCPFAYILVSLNNTGSKVSMTQLVGRVLRQPDVTKTAFSELNESYVFCLRRRAEEILHDVKEALTREGYEGDRESVVDASGDTGKDGPLKRKLVRRKQFEQLYKPFKGKIYLPRFCVRVGRDKYEGLNYFEHLISQVDVGRFDVAGIDWDLDEELKKAKDYLYRLSLEQEEMATVEVRDSESTESDEAVRSWLVANLPFEHYSFKQTRSVVGRVVDQLYKAHPALRDRLALVKFMLRDRLRGFIEEQTNLQTKAAFEKLFETKKLCFYLHCIECTFEIPRSVEVRALRRLVGAGNEPIQRSLFEAVPEDDFNEYEKEVALFMDNHPEVLWWYRNLVGAEHFSIQGYLKDRIYPDFIVQKGKPKRPDPTVLVVETKGEHLAGSLDTKYKRDIAGYFEKLGKAVPWQKLARGFANSTFRFQVLDQDQYGAWKDELGRLLIG